MNAQNSKHQMLQVVQFLDAGRPVDAREVLLDLRRREPRNRKVIDVLAKVEKAIDEQEGGMPQRLAPAARPRRQTRDLPASSDRRVRATGRPVSTGLTDSPPTGASDNSWFLVFEIGLFLVYLVIGAVGGGFIVPLFMGNFTFGLFVGAVLGVIVWFLRRVF